jgi:hypothetical protein
MMRGYSRVAASITWGPQVWLVEIEDQGDNFRSRLYLAGKHISRGDDTLSGTP